MVDLKLLEQAVMESRDGITIADARDPEYPLIFVSPGFEALTGYSRDEVLNRNCRFLQGEDRNQRDARSVRRAIEAGKYCLVTLRNFRKDGSMFWNELSLSPVVDSSGVVTHLIGIQKDVTARVLLETRLLKERKNLEHTNAKLEKLVIFDPLTGIYNRRFFEKQFDTFWNFLLETQGNLVVLFIDVDYFKLFNDTYGHMAGDEALRKVAAALHDSCNRGTDFVARYGGEEFIVQAANMSAEQAQQYAQGLCETIRSLAIPHAASPCRILTISCGYALAKPDPHTEPKTLIQQADLALYQAKHLGKNQAAGFKTLFEIPGP